MSLDICDNFAPSAAKRVSRTEVISVDTLSTTSFVASTGADVSTTGVEVCSTSGVGFLTTLDTLGSLGLLVLAAEAETEAEAEAGEDLVVVVVVGFPIVIH